MCEDFEMLMAEALGGELTGPKRERFESHLATCSACRRDYASLAQARDTLNQHGAVPCVEVRREGDQLVMGPSVLVRGRGFSWRRARSRALPVAAAIVAFLGGYASRGLIPPRPASHPHEGTEAVSAVQATATGADARDAAAGGLPFAEALAFAGRRMPDRSYLAQCLLAMSTPAARR